ncbi:PaaI family thioesterase [Tardiphaga alba]|uniref:PaaI family thioesterase n=1 Tax=Tardiphaga alba TaxID=340268 RepID=A0ABX8AC93_9BRAD|nr:PaaI family thioesterase [Tardiphaga alba]QUS40038.1 PaaI family thioesterase [Tardiphaga alba]
MSGSEVKKLQKPDIEAIFARSPFINFMNLEVLRVDHDKSEFAVRMPLRPEYERREGTQQFHGGAIAALIDVVGDFAIGMMVGGGVPTMNLRIDYLRPGVGAFLEGVAVVRKTGRTSAVIDIDIFSEDRKLVAIGRGTYVPITG